MNWHAQIKAEGKKIKFDLLEPDKPKRRINTYWFEQSFTKNQFKKLAKALKGSSDLFIQELQKEFAYRAKTGRRRFE